MDSTFVSGLQPTVGSTFPSGLQVAMTHTCTQCELRQRTDAPHRLAASLDVSPQDQKLLIAACMRISAAAMPLRCGGSLEATSVFYIRH